MNKVFILVAAFLLSACCSDKIVTQYKTMYVLTPDTALSCPPDAIAPTLPSTTQKNVAVYIQDQKLVTGNCRTSVEAASEFNAKVREYATKHDGIVINSLDQLGTK